MPRISHAMDSPRIGRRTNVFWSCASRGVTIRERSSQSAKRKEARLRRRFPADVSVKIHYRSRPRTRPHVRVPGSRGNRKLPASYELISCICKEMRWNRRKVSLYIGLSRLRGNKFNCSPRIFSGLTDTHTRKGTRLSFFARHAITGRRKLAKWFRDRSTFSSGTFRLLIATTMDPIGVDSLFPD